MAHREVCVVLDNFSWHIASSFAHFGLAFFRVLSPSSRVWPRALPILIDQRFAVRFARLSFDHPLAFVSSFSVLPNALPIIERFSTGLVFRVIVNDTHRDKLPQDFYMNRMDRSGFMFIVIMNDTHLDMHDVFVSLVV